MRHLKPNPSVFSSVRYLYDDGDEKLQRMFIYNESQHHATVVYVYVTLDFVIHVSTTLRHPHEAMVRTKFFIVKPINIKIRK